MNLEVGNYQTQNQNRKFTEKFGRDQKSGKVHVRYLWIFQVEEHVRLFYFSHSFFYPTLRLLGPVHLLGFRKFSPCALIWSSTCIRKSRILFFGITV